MKIFLAEAGDKFNLMGRAMQEGSDNPMNIYLADASPDNPVKATQQIKRRLKILLSFHYYHKVELRKLFQEKLHPHLPEVFIDSGGFSAKTQGATIDINEYAAFLKRYGDLITVYANLDAIGDPVKTWENQKRMEDMGLHPLPVFHTGEPWSFLERYVEEYPYIALGGMVPYMRQWKKLMPWLVKCFRIAEGKAVFHGFGATAWGVVNALPWYSVDSSSWGQGFRFGQIPIFDPARGKFEEAKLGDRVTCMRHTKLFEQYGFNPADFYDRARNQRTLVCGISALSYLKAEEYLQKKYGRIDIPKRGRRICNVNVQDDGLRMYLVEGKTDCGDTRPVLEYL